MTNTNPYLQGSLSRSAGVTVLEMVVVMGLFAIVMGMTALALNNVQRPLSMAMDTMKSQFTHVRTQAMSNTSAYRITPQTESKLIVESALSCAASTWTAEPTMDLDLPTQVTITNPMPLTWSVCFDTRGLASNNITITLEHPKWSAQQVEVLLGGSLREL